jgi:DMSO reductase family type II enzyme chaperone
MTLAPTAEIDEGTAARFAMYHLLADALEFPSQEFWGDVCGGTFADSLRALVEGLPYELEAPGFDRLTDGGAYVDFQGEYIRLFDVGSVRPPCPLYGGEWGMPRRRAMEDSLRFYRYFGLKMNEDARELPDHATVQMEFMQVLTYAEGEARASGKSAAPFLRAQRDFLQRHLARWWPMLRDKIGPQQPAPFYDALTALTASFLATDYAYAHAQATEGE